jgi:hypothetical protein
MNDFDFIGRKFFSLAAAPVTASLKDFAHEAQRFAGCEQTGSVKVPVDHFVFGGGS